MLPSDAASCRRRVAVWSAAFTSAITQAKLPSRSASSAIADACIEGARRGGGQRRQEDLTSVSFEGDAASVTTAESMTAQVLRKPTTVERD